MKRRALALLPLHWPSFPLLLVVRALRCAPCKRLLFGSSLSPTVLKAAMNPEFKRASPGSLPRRLMPSTPLSHIYESSPSSRGLRSGTSSPPISSPRGSSSPFARSNSLLNRSASFKRNTSSIQEVDTPPLKFVLRSYSSVKYLDSAVSSTACKMAEKRAPVFEATTRSEELAIAAHSLGGVPKKRLGSIHSKEWSHRQLPIAW